MANDQGLEIEIKLRIDNAKEVVEKLLAAGAKDQKQVFQTDILYDYADGQKTFGAKDQALRLRIEKGDNFQRANLTFKDTPTIEDSGKKIRFEFETEIVNSEAFQKILGAIGFKEALRIEKKRHKFERDEVEIAVDEAEFGNFLELEGEKEDIDKMIQKLGFDKYPVETKPYFKLLLEWQEADLSGD